MLKSMNHFLGNMMIELFNMVKTSDSELSQDLVSDLAS